MKINMILLSLLVISFHSLSAHAAPAVPEQCKTEALRAVRNKAENLFKKGDAAQAADELHGTWVNCKHINTDDSQWIASDFAYYLFKAKKKSTCKNLFCQPNGYVDCSTPKLKVENWQSEPSKATKAYEFNVRQCMKTSETGIDDDKLVDEYKIKKTSPLPICSKGPYTYIRFHKAMDDYDSSKEKIIIKISDSKKEASKLGEDEPETYLHWAGDINEDGLNDLLINKWSCGSYGDCPYVLYTYCGQGRYIALLREEGEYFNGVKIGKESKSIDGIRWNHLITTGRYTDHNLGCDDERGDFTFSQIYNFDGKKYSLSKEEAAKAKKEVDTEIAAIKKACSKKE